MATPESAITLDYGLTTREIYFAVMDKVQSDKEGFANLLSLVLGVAGKYRGLWEQGLYEIPHHSPFWCNFINHDRRTEYKVHPSERLVLKARMRHECN
jgi:hypothetical protein